MASLARRLGQAAVMRARACGLPPPLLLGLLEKRERRASLRNEGLEAFLRLLEASHDEPGVRQLVYLALGDALKAVQGADGAGRGETSGSQAPNSDLYIFAALLCMCMHICICKISCVRVCVCVRVCTRACAHVHVHVREVLTVCTYTHLLP